MSETNIKVTISPERNIVVKLDFGGYNDHGKLPGLSDDDHPQYVKHSLATAVNDFLVASGVGVFIKKTLAEVKTILGLGSAAYTESGDYATSGHGHNLSALTDDATHRTVTDTEKSTWNGKTDLATVKADTDIADALSKKHASGSDAETATSIGTLINGADAKATPVDTDMVGLMDSGASNILKKLSWSNIKATLKTYFDSLYPLKANNLSDVANAATAFGNIKQAASTTATGVVELATQAEVLAGTDTSRAVVPADLWALVAQSKNPLALAQAINMTYAASGSNGIQAANSVHLNNGLNNFALIVDCSLPNWTATAGITRRLISKAQDVDNRVLFYISMAGKLTYLHRKTGGTSVDCVCTSALTLAAGSRHKVRAEITRETASVAGSVAFYVDNILFETVAIPAGTPADITNTGIWELGGYNVTGERTAGVFAGGTVLNFIPTAAESLDIYLNGIPDSMKWGSQTSLVDPAASVFTSGTYGWTKYGNNVVANDTNQLKITYVDNSGGAYWYMQNIGDLTKDLTPYKKYRVVCDAKYSGGSAGVQLQVNGTGLTTVTSSALTTDYATYVLDFYCNITYAPYLRLANMSADNEVHIDNLYVYQIGATLALEPEGIQPAPGQWLDSSTNKNHALQPAEGSSLTRRKKDFEYRWTNTWAGTHEAQYIGGVNQNVLPSANIRIDSITMVCTATGVNVILGDGSDTDRFVASVALATYLDCTVANRNHDGTNRKLVIDPDGNFTGSITTTIKGVILD